MKNRKPYTKFIFLPYCILIFIIKLYTSPSLIFNPWICIVGSVCAIFLMYFLRNRIYCGNDFWSDISNGSLLFLAVPALVWLYFNTLISYNRDCDLFLICGICLCLLINFYSHDTFVKTGLTGILFCIGGLWLSVSSTMTIWGLLTICVISLVYVSLISLEFCYEEDIKYNRLYIIIVLLVSEYFILGSSTGIECIGLDLIKYSTRSLEDAILLYLLNYGLEFILLLIGLGIVCIFHNKVKNSTAPSIIFSFLIWGYLVIEKWNFFNCIVFIVVSVHLLNISNSIKMQPSPSSLKRSV